MSLFGALDTAVSGLGAQSTAFSNISNNVANSQTVGFKGVNTTFQDLVDSGGAANNTSGDVQAQAQYTNDVQGTITQSTDPLALAISGAGFFAVSQATGLSSTDKPTFSPETEYTRTGDFEMDANGYLVNSAGNYLQGYVPNATTGVIDPSTLQNIQVSESAYNPSATANVVLSANLPETPSTTSVNNSQVTVYDSLGDKQTLNVDWTQNSPGNWTATFSAPGNTGGSSTPAIGSATVTFNSNTTGSLTAPADGTIATITGDGVNVNAAATQTTGAAATVTMACNFDGSPQDITLSLGNFGQSTGVTQFAGTTYNERSITQDGLASGAFSSLSTQPSGNIVANYTNGATKIVAQVPVVTFDAPNALQSQNGQAYTEDFSSGAPTAQLGGSNDAGNLVTQSVESSNVDIATQFSQLIVAQQAYGANAKVVTTANTLLQDTVDLIQ